ncbi:13521_t:CDS:1, partial [Entrophospora sp. SA101]
NASTDAAKGRLVKICKVSLITMPLSKTQQIPGPFPPGNW